MPVSCPCCKASNENAPTCRRCKADLSLLFAVEDQRAFLIAAATFALHEGKFADALRSLEQAEHLRRGDDLHRLRAVVYLCSRDFGAAWQSYRRATATTRG